MGGLGEGLSKAFFFKDSKLDFFGEVKISEFFLQRIQI